MEQFKSLLKYYVATVLLFLIAKPCFVFAQSSEVRGDFGFSDLLEVWLHGLPLDLSTAAYLAAPLWLLLLITFWTNLSRVRIIYKVYVALTAVLLSVIYVSDSALYEFWGIKLDGTVWNYLDRPTAVLSSVTPAYILGVSAVLVVVGLIFYFPLSRLFPVSFRRPRCPVFASFGWLLLGGLLFLAIRGGVGKSTANVGMVYYSPRLFLNHAAVNPVFSIVSSLKREGDYGERFNFYEESERAARFARLGYSTESRSGDKTLHSSRSNVLIILMEGMGAQFVHAVNPEANSAVTPSLNRLSKEGVVFTRCYANSFRTDRGTVSTLSGTPAYPDLSIMKRPALAAAQPSIARTLKRAGYRTEFLYGGDINFTNTNGYLLATGYDRTFGDTDFPLAVRRTHDWGVTDRIVFDSLFARIARYPVDRPWHTTLLTLASHEPWRVPYDRIKNDPVANSMAYLDDCIGRFVERFRSTPAWENTLVVLIPDHGIPYPVSLSDEDPRKSRIPMIWTGGVISAPRRVETLMNQSDFAATLLGQLGLPHDDFPMSRDVMSASYRRPSAVHVWNEGIWYMDETGLTVLNLLKKPATVTSSLPAPSAEREEAAKVYLQTAFDLLEQYSK